MRRWGGIIAIVVALLCGQPAIVLADQAVVLAEKLHSSPLEYRFASGYRVKDAFATYYERTGAADLLGPPITDAFIQGNRQVQCFANMALAQPMGGGPVAPVPISTRLGKGTPPLPASLIPDTNDHASLYAPETGHLVTFPFYEFFQNHGGARFLGHPISHIQVEAGRIVQYFENARLEWDDNGGYVRMGELGQAYLAYLDLPATLLMPTVERRQQQDAAQAHLESQTWPEKKSLEKGGMAETTPVQTPKLPLLQCAGDEPLVVTVRARYPQLGITGQQSLQIRVQDGAGKPIAAARVIVAHTRGGETQRLAQGLTGSDGRLTLSFDIGSPPLGMPMVVDIAARSVADRANQRHGAAQIAFTPWW